MSKGFFYIDDSIHDDANFILCACCYLTFNPDLKIRKIIKCNGFNPDEFEYSSGYRYQDNKNLLKLRSDIYDFINDNCLIGIVVAPKTVRPKIGEICIEAVEKFIKCNDLVNKVESVHIDQGMNLGNKRRIIQDTEIIIHAEQNSLEIRGIQLADYCAHTLSVWLKGSMGITDKKIVINDIETELHFEMFARLRYNLFKKQENKLSESRDLVEQATYKVQPYGLYISEELDDSTKKFVQDTFSEVYVDVSTKDLFYRRNSSNLLSTIKTLQNKALVGFLHDLEIPLL